MTKGDDNDGFITDHSREKTAGVSFCGSDKAAAFELQM